MKIGIFDSGLGGLTILKAIANKLPEYDYLYLGDNARVPYGGRSSEVIYQFTRQAVEFLFNQNCKLVILACNSATANALRRLQHEDVPKHYPDRRVLGIIKPTVEYIEEHQQKKVGIIGTYATVESGAYLREISKVAPQCLVTQASCPLLVPLIEENETEGSLLEQVIDKYLSVFKQDPPQTVLLACTHYGLVKNELEQYLGDEVAVVDQGQLVADKLAHYLARHPEISRHLSRHKERRYYVTDLNSRFQAVANRFLGSSINLEKITL